MFSKIYENVPKTLIDTAMTKYLSHFIFTYWQNCSTQYALILLSEDPREDLDHNFVVGGVFIDLSKAFDCIPLWSFNYKAWGLLFWLLFR